MLDVIDQLKIYQGNWVDAISYGHGYGNGYGNGYGYGDGYGSGRSNGEDNGLTDMPQPGGVTKYV